MILADTNILSTFAKVGRLPLLLGLFAGNPVAVVPAVLEELREGVKRGYALLQDVVDLIETGSWGLHESMKV